MFSDEPFADWVLSERARSFDGSAVEAARRSQIRAWLDALVRMLAT